MSRPRAVIDDLERLYSESVDRPEHTPIDGDNRPFAEWMIENRGVVASAPIEEADLRDLMRTYVGAEVVLESIAEPEAVAAMDGIRTDGTSNLDERLNDLFGHPGFDRLAILLRTGNWSAARDILLGAEDPHYVMVRLSWIGFQVFYKKLAASDIDYHARRQMLAVLGGAIGAGKAAQVAQRRGILAARGLVRVTVDATVPRVFGCTHRRPEEYKMTPAGRKKVILTEMTAIDNRFVQHVTEPAVPRDPMKDAERSKAREESEFDRKRRLALQRVNEDLGGRYGIDLFLVILELLQDKIRVAQVTHGHGAYLLPHKITWAEIDRIGCFASRVQHGEDPEGVYAFRRRLVRYLLALSATTINSSDGSLETLIVLRSLNREPDPDAVDKVQAVVDGCFEHAYLELGSAFGVLYGHAGKKIQYSISNRQRLLRAGHIPVSQYGLRSAYQLLLELIENGTNKSHVDAARNLAAMRANLPVDIREDYASDLPLVAITDKELATIVGIRLGQYASDLSRSEAKRERDTFEKLVQLLQDSGDISSAPGQRPTIVPDDRRRPLPPDSPRLVVVVGLAALEDHAAALEAGGHKDLT